MGRHAYRFTVEDSSTFSTTCLAVGLPVWIKPNAGLPVVKDGKTFFPMGPVEFDSFVPAIISAGANFVGGCCGCGPGHVRAMRQAMR